MKALVLAYDHHAFEQWKRESEQRYERAIRVTKPEHLLGLDPASTEIVTLVGWHHTASLALFDAINSFQAKKELLTKHLHDHKAAALGRPWHHVSPSGSLRA